MYYGKSPASRRAGRGLFLPLFILSIAALSLVPGVSVSASPAISVSQNFYDYVEGFPPSINRLTGQGISVVWDKGAYGIGMNIERAEVISIVPGWDFKCYYVSMVIEKSLVKGATVGGGAGFLKSYFNGSPFMLSRDIDIYGRVQVLKIGKATVGTFIRCRWSNPSPFVFGRDRVTSSGIEIGIGQ